MPKLMLVAALATLALSVCVDDVDRFLHPTPTTTEVFR